MIGGKIFAAKFPQGGVEVTNIDDITGGILNLNTIAHAIGMPDQDVDPAEKTCHRRLHGQANDDRADSNGDQRGVPINENDADDDDGDDKGDEQMFDPAQRETRSGIIKSSDGIDGNGFGNREHDHNQHRAAEKSPCEIDDVLRHRNQLRSDEIIKNGTARSEEHSLNSSHVSISYAVFCLKKKK